ncbi:endonuclease/exonuclease/phosphatase family protein [uncultured Mesonia sp.]|uniref:endonuclease/exonuclease/phosphatase family protein n=1 Tax=uncultured Mesonia sp. TaxID=399731 RepID=UPI00374EC716
MGNWKKVVRIVFDILAILIALASILSVFRNTEWRYLKFLDFPRIQLFFTALVGFVLIALIPHKHKLTQYVIMACLIVGLGLNLRYLLPYTILSPKDVPQAENITAKDQVFSVFLSNVKMKNNQHQALLDLIKEKEPDLVLLMEVNARWDQAVKSLAKDYPYVKKAINEKAYGMALYSKIPWKNAQVHYLNNEHVPSIITEMELASGKRFTLYNMHPVPPKHFEHLPDNKGQQEKELIKMGRMIKQNQLACLVMGDMNDVVWSHVDPLTKTKDLLKDVRVGRGVFPSFHTQKWYMRWPLDHIFTTEGFRVKTLERLPSIGSDHFPLYAELVL